MWHVLSYICAVTLSVRIPHRVEQELADYCAKHRVSKSEAVKKALEQFLSTKSDQSPYDLVKDLLGPDPKGAATEDTARNSKQLLRERFRGSRR